MPLVVVGVLLLVAKMADLGPTASWSWWIVAAPFVAAVLWWQFADSTGLTQRRAMRKMDERKAQRRDRSLAALGIDIAQKKHHRRLREHQRDEQRAAPDRKSPPPRGG